MKGDNRERMCRGYKRRGKGRREEKEWRGEEIRRLEMRREQRNGKHREEEWGEKRRCLRRGNERKRKGM